MDAAAAEKSINERLRRNLNDVNAVAHSHLAPLHHHIHFTLQQAYFKCAYECFDRSKKQDEISTCVEHCSAPVLAAQNLVENEMAKFQETLSRALRGCQDKYGSAILQTSSKKTAIDDLELCVDLSVRNSKDNIPHLAGKLKEYLSLKD